MTEIEKIIYGNTFQFLLSNHFTSQLEGKPSKVPVIAKLPGVPSSFPVASRLCQVETCSILNTMSDIPHHRKQFR
jgi:hypothetical protein